MGKNSVFSTVEEIGTYYSDSWSLLFAAAIKKAITIYTNINTNTNTNNGNKDSNSNNSAITTAPTIAFTTFRKA